MKAYVFCGCCWGYGLGAWQDDGRNIEYPTNNIELRGKKDLPTMGKRSLSFSMVGALGL